MPDLPRIRDKYYKQFDKYFIFVEQAIRKTKDAGYICYIVPNKFFKVGAGEHLRSLIAKGRYLVSLDDFGDAQLFEDKTIYSSILLLCKSPQEKFRYTGVDSADKLWVGEEVSSIEFGSSILNKLRMAITQGRDGSKSYLSLFIITANNPFNPKQLRSAIALTESNATISASELVVAGNEIAIGVDPTVYPAADYLLNMGAGEILFKADANGVIQPYFAKDVSQLDEYTWEIKLHPNATFWSGDPADAEAVIASLMRSKALDPKANPFLQGIDFTAVDSETIQAVTETPNVDITLNLSFPQLLIHNTAEKYTYESIETADYTGMYRIVEFKPAQCMVFEKNENYWGTKPEIQRVVHEQIGDADARVIAALSGRYHVVMDIPQSAYSQFDNSEEAKIVLVPGAQTQTICFNYP